ncbi:MAG: XdhC/CoxI family protein [Elusimicrobiota bacterium]|nr:XdhC/CoxI family protein [Elusimicrobiota bacterium]
MIDIDKIRQIRENGVPAVIATVTKISGSVPRSPGTSMIIFEDGTCSGTVGGGALEKMVIAEAAKVMKKGVSRSVSFNLGASAGGGAKGSIDTGMACGGRTEIFLDLYKPLLKLFICGAGHIGQVMARLSKIMKWECELVDNRKEYLKKTALKNASFVSSYKKAFNGKKIDSGTAVIIVTHNHAGDRDCLRGALKTKSFYIGVIGSRSKVPAVFAGLPVDGRVFSPIGLDLGGESPEEISLCITAEIMKFRNKTLGGHLRIPPLKALRPPRRMRRGGGRKSK